MPHSKQCGFTLHPDRLRTSLYNPGSAPHPSLLNVLYLLGCHFSQSPSLAALETSFLERSLRGISNALANAHPPVTAHLVNVVQASALLAVYFFAKGRLLEGYYHSSSASRLAISLGLHQIRTPTFSASTASSQASTWNGSPPSSVPLPPPRDSIELGERIHAFWQVFIVDRCWSVATGLPSTLPDDDHPQLNITTVWPRPIEEYSYPEQSLTLVDHHYLSLNSLCAEGDITTPYASPLTLRAKAATFFENASRISTQSCTYVSE